MADPDFKGWMTVFAGTNELFSLLSATYSPVLRHFVKVYLVGFRQNKETENCISINLSEEDKAFFDYTSVDEIHRLTNGNPYEVQLVAFYMYKRYERLKLPRITLDHEVLDSVLSQLEEVRTATVSHIPVIKELSLDGLRSLQLVLPFEGWTIEQICRYDIIGSGISADQGRDIVHDYEALKTQIQRTCATHEASGLLKIDDGRVFFNGDRFDRLYLKYFAEANRIHWNMLSQPYHAAVSEKVQEMLCNSKLTHGWTKRLQVTERNTPLRQYILAWKAKLEDGTFDIEEESGEIYIIEDKDFVRSFVYNLRRPEFLSELLRSDQSKKDVVGVKVQFGQIGDKSTYLSLYTSPHDEDLEKLRVRVRGLMDSIGNYSEVLDFTVEDVDALRLEFLSLDDIALRAVRLKNQSLIREVQLAYLYEGREAFGTDNIEQSFKLFQRVLQLPAQEQDPLYLAIAHNNLGFVLGALGRFDEALLEWDQALALYPKTFGQLGMTYQDISYVSCKLGQYEKALEMAKKAIEVDRNMNVKVGWLFVKFCSTRFQRPSTWRWELITHPRVATAAYCNMVAIYAEQNDFDTALLYARKAEKSSRDQPVALRAQGWLALKMQDWSLALDRFLSAQRMSPNDPIINEEVMIASTIAHEKLG